MTDQYATIRALRNGEVIDLEGLKLRMVEGDIKPGDLYIAERNTGPELLTAAAVIESNGWGESEGYIIPRTINYAYDLSECVKVEEA